MAGITYRRIAVLLVLVVAAVLLAGRLAAGRVRDGALPTVGFRVHDTVLTFLPSGGTLLLVSESCVACRNRAKALVRRVARRVDHALLVTTGGGVTVRGLVEQSPEVTARTMFLSLSEMADWTGARAVPVYVTVDAEGRVAGAGPSTIGWLGSVANPANWWRAWARLLQRNS